MLRSSYRFSSTVSNSQLLNDPYVLRNHRLVISSPIIKSDMSDETDKTAQYLERAKGHFSENCLNMERPASNRECKDAAFLVLFVLVFGAYIGYGAYAIQIVYTQSLYANDTSAAKLLAFLSLDMIKASLGYVIGMLGLALCFAIIILVMLRYATFAAYVVMLVMTFVGLIALLAICFAFKQIAFGIVMCVLLALLFITWLCYRKELLKIVVIMKTVAIFLSARPMVFVMTLACQTFTMASSIFWIAGYYSIITFYNQYAITEVSFILLTIFWMFCGFYFLFFFFYGMAFLIGAETAIWFYKSPHYSIASPFKWLIRSHLGSLSLAAFLIAMIKTAQVMVILGRTRNAKGIAGFILVVLGCIFRCVLNCLEFWVQIINNYAVIVVALTGKGYIDSALTSSLMIFSNPIGYNTFTLISYFVRIAGTFTCVFIPTLISYFLFQLIPLPPNLTVVGMGIVLFFTTMVSLVLLETIIEAMDSMFVFYSLEAQMGEFGQRVNEIIEEEERLEAIYAEGLEDNFIRIQRKKAMGPDQTIEIIANGQKTVVEDGKVVKVQQLLPMMPVPTMGQGYQHVQANSSANIQHPQPLGMNRPYQQEEQKSSVE